MTVRKRPVFSFLLALSLMHLSLARLSKRSDDANPLESVVNRLTQDLTQLQAQVTALQNSAAQKTDMAKIQADLQALKAQEAKRVAFFAMAPGDSTNAQVTVPAQAPIHFTSVTFNLGHAYDPTLGVFTAPFSGVYVFTYQVYTTFDGDKQIDLMRNGHIIVRTRITDEVDESHDLMSEAVSSVQHANAGDKFWVQLTVSGTVEFGPHTFFSGTLVSPDP